MRSLLMEIDKIGLNILVKNGEILFDPAEGISEAEIAHHAPQIHDLLSGKLPLENDTSNENISDFPSTEAFPLTDIQYAYLIGRNPGLELGGLSSCLYMEMDIEKLDLNALNSALNEIIKLHPMLRAVIRTGGQQQILPEVAPYEIDVKDGRGWTKSEAYEHLTETRQEMEGSLLSLDLAPTFEVKATIISNDITRLHLSFDLMFLDIQSVRIVLRDWWQSYKQGSLDKLSSAPAFANYLEAERVLQGKPQGLRDQQYWKSLLDKLPPAPELPLKCSPELISRPTFNRVSKLISAVTIDKIKQAAEARGLTLESVFLGAYVETLRLWSKRQTFTLTLTQLGRRTHFEGIENTVGNFLQPALLGAWGSKEASFTERLVQLQTDLVMNRLHSSYNGIQVLRELTSLRQESRMVSVPIVFSNTLNTNLQETITDWEWDGATQVYSSNQTPQLWLENQITAIDGAIGVNWNYVDGLFPEGMIDTMLDAYIKLISACAEDAEIWDRTGSVVELPSIDLMERKQANTTSVAIKPRLLHEMVLEAANKFPQSIAIAQGVRQMTYEELIAKASQVAHRIREQLEISPGDFVAVSLPQSPELVVGILGVLIAGAAYVAIDPSLPEQRKNSLLKRCSAKGVVLDTATFPDTSTLVQLPCIDLDDSQIHTYDTKPPQSIQSVNDLAYVIFTSGSTGEPKGVMIAHRNASNTVLDINRRFNVTNSDAVFSVAPAGFDLSVYDYFGLLGIGGKVVFQTTDSTNDPQIWCNTLIDHSVTIWNSVPALVKVLVDRCGEDLPNTQLRLILMSGDWIPVDLPKSIREPLPNASVISLGGATEGSIWSICYPIEEVDQKWTSIPYGKPLANQQFHVLNDWLEPSPKWVTGELYIAGEGVAQGYLADPEKTAQRFFTHPTTGERLYKTGDLGRYTTDGLIEILGREDNQVKINGYRVELGEVEACLLAHHCASHVVIDAPIHPKTGQRHLAAYVVPTEEYSKVDPTILQEQLKAVVQQELPSYMVPTYFVLLSHMPLTNNGKINRSALPTPWPEAGEEATETVEPNSDIEARLLKLWREQLQHDDFGVTSGFFDIGGDSLHAVALLSALRKEFSVTPIQEQDLIEGLFMNSNIKAFAQIIESLTQPAEQTPEENDELEVGLA